MFTLFEHFLILLDIEIVHLIARVNGIHYLSTVYRDATVQIRFKRFQHILELSRFAQRFFLLLLTFSRGERIYSSLHTSTNRVVPRVLHRCLLKITVSSKAYVSLCVVRFRSTRANSPSRARCRDLPPSPHPAELAELAELVKLLYKSAHLLMRTNPQE